MTPEQHRLERARQQIASSTASPPTGIDPIESDVPSGPGAPLRQPLPRQPLTGVQVFFAVFFGVLLASMVWSFLRRLFWEIGWGILV